MELIKVYFQFVIFFTKSRNFEKVAFYQNKYITLKDSIYNEELTTNLMKVEAEHLEKENKAKIESQAKILALNEEVILRQKFLNAFIGLVAVLLIALTIVLFRSNRQKRMVNQLLDEKVKERTQELEVNRNTLQKACDERDIIIHKAATDISSTVATIKGLCALGLKDTQHENACEYLTRVDVTSNKFSEILSKLFFARKIGT